MSITGNLIAVGNLSGVVSPGQVGGGSGGGLYDFVQYTTGTSNPLTIPSDFFRNQANMKTYTGPNYQYESVTIGGRAFKDCVNLEAVYLPWCELVNENTFDGCEKLKDLYIGTTVNGGVSTVVNVGTTLANVERIHVPANMLDTYKEATGWKTIPDKLIGDYER